MKYIIDTNALLNNIEVLDKYDAIIPSHINREIENLELTRKSDSVLQWKIRNLKRKLDDCESAVFENTKDYKFTLSDDLDPQYVDNIILQIAHDEGYGVITNDRLLRMKCKQFNIDVINPTENSDEVDESYKGFKRAYMDEEEHQDFYINGLDKNTYNLEVNEYLIIIHKTKKTELDALKWDGKYHQRVAEKKLQSNALKTFKPYDLYQRCAIDTVMNNQFSILRGKAGVAKTQIAIAYAMKEIQSYSPKYTKLIIFSNAVPTYGAYYHGLVRGDLNTKLLDSSIGNILSGKLGSRIEVESMIISEQLVILPASDIRGFDSSGMNAIILITEGQNFSRELLKLAIQRTGSDCKLIIEGDNSTQLDDEMFSGSNNGMRVASQVFRGQEYYGEVELQNIYRSEIASRAELMTLL